MTNEEVLRKVNQQPKLLKLMMKQKTAHMGHHVRKNDNILEQLLIWKIDGKKSARKTKNIMD